MAGRNHLVAVSPVLPAHRQVADQLQRLILTGELEPGRRLPSEIGLAADFGVSRNTLRAALKILAERQLIRTSRGATGGTVVVGPNPDLPPGDVPACPTPFDEWADIGCEQLLEARAMFEVEAARLAAERREARHLMVLRDVMDREIPSDRRGRFERHRSFHLGVLAAAQNAMLVMLAEPVFHMVQTRFLVPGVEATYWHRVEQEHRDLLSAIEDGDAARAVRIAVGHLATVKQAYLGVTAATG